MDKRDRAGFTLIELLVAMSMLVVIIMIVGMFFQRASVAWDTGTRKAETLLKGRAVADYISQEMQMAMPTSDFDVSAAGDTAKFVFLGEATGTARATQLVDYAFSSSDGKVKRNDKEMCDGVYQLEFEEGPSSIDPNSLPLWVDIRVGVTNSGVTNWFQSRVSFANRRRDGI